MLVYYNLFEAWAGIEPAHVGFADRSVTTSPPGHIDSPVHYNKKYGLIQSEKI